MERFLFIDRDGTLIAEPADQQIDSLEKFQLLPGVIAALTRLSAAGYKLVMISNQDGLGTAQNPQDKFDMIQKLLLQILNSQGIQFHEILICPHRSEENCACRKPKTQLVRSYLASNQMDRENSYVLGDRRTDMELAENMGVKGLLLQSGMNWVGIAAAILDQPRVREVRRKTNETEIVARVNLDPAASETSNIQTGIGFFDHMLDQLSRHGGFSLQLSANGDLHIDDHHLIEDVALTLGAALREALGTKRGIGRYGFWLPMDEADTRVTIDLSGRAHFAMHTELPASMVGGLSREMVPHFFKSLADAMQMSLHIETRGQNSHHMVESMFKATGRALRLAMARGESQAVPSTKGSL